MDQHNCPVVQIIEDDKGVHVVAAINLFTTLSQPAEAAIAVARNLRDHQVGLRLKGVL